MRKKALIVDDNEANLFSLVKIMEKLDLTIHTAKSGKEALLLFDKNFYNLVLLDIQMPEMDGFEVLERMRQTPGKKFIPVILISAIFTEDQYKLKGIQTGAVDFLPKPVNPNIIRAKARIFLELEDHKESLKTLIKELEDTNNQLIEEITRRKKIEKELIKAKSLAEKNSEIQNQILVNMSHEIRTPVNSILGFADLIANPDISSGDKERYVRYVSNSSHNLLFLIDEILDHSRIEAGEFKINAGTCNLTEMLTELKESFDQIKKQQGKENLEIILNLPEDHLMIKSDPQRVRQVLINLTSNAVKYTEKGKITLGYHKHKSKVRITVADTGIGIPEEELENLFNRFKRVESEDSLKSQGTGLGLSISKRIVELLGGEIGVESTLGEGSEFFVQLPFETVEGEMTSTRNDTKTEDLDPEWEKHHIVIAEDEEMNFLFLQEALRSTKIRITWAKNGMEAIEKTLETNPDLVLMDVKLPDINGFEAIEQIRKKRPGQIVVVQTAFAIADKEIIKYEDLFDDVVTKPINRTVLISKMSKYLI